MAELRTDRELLREYVIEGSEMAFQALVQRHANLVFATALRGINEPGTAQEIAQNVFIALACKAAWLQGETNVAGWLHKTTLLEVRQWWRGELRRQRREHTAMELGTMRKDEDSLLQTLVGELDEGLLGLRESDRQALILRYFEGRSHREIGVLLGAREDAVRMRIDKALERLTKFFRRRGYAVPAVATTVAVLGAAAKAAPGGFVAAATQAATAAAGGGAATGLKMLLVRLAALTKTQTALLCVTIAAAPVAWQAQVNRMAHERTAQTQSRLADYDQQQEQTRIEIDRLRAESAQLNARLEEAFQRQARSQETARKLEALRSRLRGLLTDTNYHWPEDLPYVRVRKATVSSLSLLDNWPGTFGPSGVLTEQAQELFGISAKEKAPTEQALASYWRGVDELTATANAYETNAPAEPGRLTKTVVVPPLGGPLKALAQQTSAELTQVLGPQREKLLFGGWDQGGIQIFWPGNLWNIAEEPQTFSVWVDPASTNGSPHFGTGWHQGSSGMSSEGQWSLGNIPPTIMAQYFAPWLSQFGIAVEAQTAGGNQ